MRSTRLFLAFALASAACGTSATPSGAEVEARCTAIGNRFPQECRKEFACAELGSRTVCASQAAALFSCLEKQTTLVCSPSPAMDVEIPAGCLTVANALFGCGKDGGTVGDASTD